MIVAQLVSPSVALPAELVQFFLPSPKIYDTKDPITFIEINVMTSFKIIENIYMKLFDFAWFI